MLQPRTHSELKFKFNISPINKVEWRFNFKNVLEVLILSFLMFRFFLLFISFDGFFMLFFLFGKPPTTHHIQMRWKVKLSISLYSFPLGFTCAQIQLLRMFILRTIHSMIISWLYSSSFTIIWIAWYPAHLLSCFIMLYYVFHLGRWESQLVIQSNFDKWNGISSGNRYQIMVMRSNSNNKCEHFNQIHNQDISSVESFDSWQHLHWQKSKHK